MVRWHEEEVERSRTAAPRSRGIEEWWQGNGGGGGGSPTDTAVDEVSSKEWRIVWHVSSLTINTLLAPPNSIYSIFYFLVLFCVLKSPGKGRVTAEVLTF